MCETPADYCLLGLKLFMGFNSRNPTRFSRWRAKIHFSLWQRKRESDYCEIHPEVSSLQRFALWGKKINLNRLYSTGKWGISSTTAFSSLHVTYKCVCGGGGGYETLLKVTAQRYGLIKNCDSSIKL